MLGGLVIVAHGEGIRPEKANAKPLSDQSVTARLEQIGEPIGEEDAESHGRRTDAEPGSVGDGRKVRQPTRYLTPKASKTEDEEAPLDSKSEDELPSPSELVRREGFAKLIRSRSRDPKMHRL